MGWRELFVLRHARSEEPVNRDVAESSAQRVSVTVHAVNDNIEAHSPTPVTLDEDGIALVRGFDVVDVELMAAEQRGDLANAVATVTIRSRTGKSLMSVNFVHVASAKIA